MKSDKKWTPVPLKEGYQPKPDETRGYQPDNDTAGYQPQGRGPVNVQDLKPPSGGSAIQPPRSSTPESKK